MISYSIIRGIIREEHSRINGKVEKLTTSETQIHTCMKILARNTKERAQIQVCVGKENPERSLNHQMLFNRTAR